MKLLKLKKVYKILKKNISLIIMSAGESTRFRKQCRIKKHWLRIDSKPLWQFVADNLVRWYEFSDVIITASKEDCAYMQRFCDYNIIEGGNTRTKSLQNALQNVNSEFVAVSDAARFELDFSVLDSLFSYDMKDCDCLIPTISVNDTIFMESGDSITYLPRECAHLVQTPQISRTNILKEALNAGDFSDESSAIHQYGGVVAFINGSKKLRKLTYFEDLKDYELVINNDTDVFVGYGFDVHKFSCESKDMYLGGVKIPCDVGFEAHSDGDVVLHALCDAILGAIGAGDIGEWFPPNDMRYKNVDSKKLLHKVINFAYSVGYEIKNIDIMIMAQKPIITPYKNQMIDVMADMLDIRKNHINIKATTMEKMGFIGREEGVCVSATATLAYKKLYF